MARPRIEIDKGQFEKLCAIQCTLPEFASYFGCSDDTIERWCKKTYKQGFAEVFKEKRGIGFISLRRTQYAMAETNPTMAIWLGKQWLGQTDKKEIAVSNTADDTVKEMDEYFRQKTADQRPTLE